MTGRLIAFAALSMLVAPAVVAADVEEFRKVDVFIADKNGDEKKKDARLEIDTNANEIPSGRRETRRDAGHVCGHPN